MIQSSVCSVSAMDIGMLVARFITLEALAARSSRETALPTSLASITRKALLDLLREYDLSIDEHDPMFIDAIKRILSPKPYADVEHAMATLVGRGYRLVCLPVHSETTMQQLRACIPEVFTNNTTLWTKYVSPYATADDTLLRGFAGFCGALVGRTDDSELPKQEILVVSSSMGRVLHCAVEHYLTTAHIRRPGNLEGSVIFKVGTTEERSTPVPSVVVDGLTELCSKL